MKNVKVVKILYDGVSFDDGSTLESYHSNECCESHYLNFSDLTIKDFDGLEFDLSTDNFFERVEGYGIALKPLNGNPVRVPGYGSNNGNYSSELDLILKKDGKEIKLHDITECQKLEWW